MCHVEEGEWVRARWRGQRRESGSPQWRPDCLADADRLHPVSLPHGFTHVPIRSGSFPQRPRPRRSERDVSRHVTGCAWSSRKTRPKLPLGTGRMVGEAEWRGALYPPSKSRPAKKDETDGCRGVVDTGMLLDADGSDLLDTSLANDPSWTSGRGGGGRARHVLFWRARGAAGVVAARMMRTMC